MLTRKQVNTVKAIIKNTDNFKKAAKALKQKEPSIYEYFKALNPNGRGIRRIDIYHTLYPDKKGKCATCSKQTVFGANNVFGYAKFCSKKCANTFNTLKGVFKKAMLLKYGVSNPSQSKTLQDKKKQTCLANHGVEFPQQSKAIRDKTTRSIQHKYGVSNVSELPSIQKKREKTMRKRFGTSNVMHNPDMLEHAMYQAHRVKKLTVQGKEFNYMGYEGRFITYLVETVGVKAKHISTSAKDMPEIFYTIAGKKKKYTPDVMFKHKGKTWVVEVKSTFTGGITQSNRQVFSVLRHKALAASKVCNFAVVFIAERGKGMKIFKDFSTFTRRHVKKEVLSSFAR